MLIVGVLGRQPDFATVITNWLHMEVPDRLGDGAGAVAGPCDAGGCPMTRGRVESVGMLSGLDRVAWEGLQHA
jgi:hypothetical protein